MDLDALERLSDEERLDRLEREADALEARLIASAKRIADRRAWDAEHLAVLETKVTKADAQRFRRLCASVGETPYAVIKRWVLDALGNKRGV